MTFSLTAYQLNRSVQVLEISAILKAHSPAVILFFARRRFLAGPAYGTANEERNLFPVYNHHFIQRDFIPKNQYIFQQFITTKQKILLQCKI